MTGFAQANTAWNITKSTPKRMSNPHTGCKRTLSTRALSVSGRAGITTDAAIDPIGLALRGAQLRRCRG